jgi:hypothetical protein
MPDVRDKILRSVILIQNRSRTIFSFKEFVGPAEALEEFLVHRLNSRLGRRPSRTLNEKLGLKNLPD